MGTAGFSGGSERVIGGWEPTFTCCGSGMVVGQGGGMTVIYSGRGRDYERRRTAGFMQRQRTEIGKGDCWLYDPVVEWNREGGFGVDRG